MKYPALAPPIGGQVIIVVNLLNHEKSRGRTSSAASCLMEDVMALGARSPTPARRSVSPTFMPYKNVTRGMRSLPCSALVRSEELSEDGMHLHCLLLLYLLVGPEDDSDGQQEAGSSGVPHRP